MKLLSLIFATIFIVSHAYAVGLGDNPITVSGNKLTWSNQFHNAAFDGNAAQLGGQANTYYRNAANHTNQLYSWGMTDPIPTNATYNIIWSPVFPRAATITGIRSKTQGGTVVFDVLTQAWNDNIGTYTTINTVTAGTTATNITSGFSSTAISNNYMVGVISTNVSSATNWWFSIEYSVP